MEIVFHATENRRQNNFIKWERTELIKKDFFLQKTTSHLAGVWGRVKRANHSLFWSQPPVTLQQNGGCRLGWGRGSCARVHSSRASKLRQDSKPCHTGVDAGKCCPPKTGTPNHANHLHSHNPLLLCRKSLEHTGMLSLSFSIYITINI